MTMDNTEIINNYRAAKDKREQLGILAELNECSKAQIAETLIEAGESVDGRWYRSGDRRPRAKTSAAPAQQEAPDAAPAQQDTPEPPAKDSRTLTLTRAEYFALRKYMEETLTAYIHDKTECANANLGELYAITGVWAKVMGGRE